VLWFEGENQRFYEGRADASCGFLVMLYLRAGGDGHKAARWLDRAHHEPRNLILSPPFTAEEVLMSKDELVADMRAAASSLVTASAAVENGDLAAAEIGVEDALFRSQSLLRRIQQAQVEAEVAPSPERRKGHGKN
jgi:hypothetical protein